MRKNCRIALILLVLALPGFRGARAGAQAARTDSGSGNTALSGNFRGLSLGMGLEELKSALTEDSLFNFRGDRDVSFLPRREESLVETMGLSFIRRAFFQLRDGKVFIMAFSLDTARVDYYSVYRALVEKYGEPGTLNPREAVWETEGIRLSVERPLTVKYIDNAVFTQIMGESEAAESSELERRQGFLNDF
jgi:hypothetical protein